MGSYMLWMESEAYRSSYTQVLTGPVFCLEDRRSPVDQRATKVFMAASLDALRPP